MRNKYLRVIRSVSLSMTAAIAVSAGCTSSDVSTSGASNTTSGPSSGSTSSGQVTAMGSTSAGQSTSSTGAQGTTAVAAVTSGTTGGPPMNCMDVSACGGDVVGTWNVASSCLLLSGDMDILLTSLGCTTVPVTGYLQTTGTFTANSDGTYTDNTQTVGNVTFPVDASCLSISSVPVECDRLASIFEPLGWTEGSCAITNGQCECALTTQQEAGLGNILSYTEPTGNYQTDGNTLSAGNASASYCAMGDTLTITPTMSALTGTVVFQREGTAVTNTTGGMGTTGGMSTTGDMGTTMGAGGSTSTTGEGTTSTTGGPAAGDRPCDIYEAAGLTCVAAHSTVRALFSAYDGALYQVRRSDGQMQDIPTLSPGGYADSSVQDSFCNGSTCTIWRLYDQSGHGNFLEAQTADSTVGGHANMTAANATAEQLMVAGNPVYSVYTRPAQAYWNDGSENDMPLGAEPQGVYMVTSGEHYNNGCCYNYGSGQLSRTYEGGPTMDAVYFGNCDIWGTGAGEGPWVMADMEDGIASGAGTGNNPDLESLPFPFVTALEKNNGTTEYAIKGASTTDSTLNTYYQGALPPGKNPMRKQGSVLLGAGGDCCYSNTNASEGTFYEGAIVSGYPSDETDQAIHENIVEAGYGQ